MESILVQPVYFAVAHRHGTRPSPGPPVTALTLTTRLPGSTSKEPSCLCSSFCLRLLPLRTPHGSNGMSIPCHLSGRSSESWTPPGMLRPHPPQSLLQKVICATLWCFSGDSRARDAGLPQGGARGPGGFGELGDIRPRRAERSHRRLVALGVRPRWPSDARSLGRCRSLRVPCRQTGLCPSCGPIRLVRSPRGQITHLPALGDHDVFSSAPTITELASLVQGEPELVYEPRAHLSGP